MCALQIMDVGLNAVQITSILLNYGVKIENGR